MAPAPATPSPGSERTPSAHRVQEWYAQAVVEAEECRSTADEIRNMSCACPVSCLAPSVLPLPRLFPKGARRQWHCGGVAEVVAAAYGLLPPEE